MKNKFSERNYQNFVKNWKGDGGVPSFEQWLKGYAEETKNVKTDDVPEDTCLVCGSNVLTSYEKREANHFTKEMTVKYKCETCGFTGLQHYTFEFVEHEDGNY